MAYFENLEKSKELPTIISFSPVNTPKGTHKPRNSLLDVSANIVFVNDAGNNWYQNGINGIAKGPLQAAQKLVKIAKEIGNGQVVTFGTSMGAHGAVLYGSLGGADACLAFGAESILGIPGSRSDRFMTKNDKIAYPDFVKEIRVPTYLICSEDDEVDLYNSYRCMASPFVHTYSIRGVGHPGVQVIENLSEFLNKFLSSRTIDLSNREGEIFKYPETIRSLFEAYLLKMRESSFYESLILDIAKRNNHALPYIRLAETLRASKKFKEAMESWEKALTIDPLAYQALTGIGSWPEKLAIESIKILEESAKINPFHGLTFLHLGKAYLRANDFLRAQESFASAIKVDPRLKAAKIELQELHSAMENPPPNTP